MVYYSYLRSGVWHTHKSRCRTILDFISTDLYRRLCENTAVSFVAVSYSYESLPHPRE